MPQSATSLKDLLSIAAGAAAGGALRHLATRGSSSPRAALLHVAAVNIAGSFTLGTMHGLQTRKLLSRRVSLALTTGFCGGFTTFSTFAAGALDAGCGDFGMGVAYVVGSCFLGVLAVAVGRRFGARVSGM